MIVPASSSTIGAGPLTSPALEMTIDLPFSGFVNVPLNEPLSVKLSSAKRLKLSVTTTTASTGIPQSSSEKLSVKWSWNCSTGFARARSGPAPPAP